MPHMGGKTTLSGSLEIKMRCDACGHVWPSKIPQTRGSKFVLKTDKRPKD